MMFDVRCLGCGKSIAKGVRFNAHKKVVSEYLGTKVYEFSMRCHLCSHRLKVRTDPKNCDYILHEGLQKVRPDAQQEVIENTKKEPSNAFSQIE